LTCGLKFSAAIIVIGVIVIFRLFI